MATETQWNTAKQYTSDVAADWADLRSIASDLTFVISICDLLLDDPEEQAGTDASNEKRILTRLAMWNAAVVAYARCFTTGVRTRLDSTAIDPLPLQAKTSHQYFSDSRNKFIAHSVNRFDESVVAALVSPPPTVALHGVTCILVKPVDVTDTNCRVFRALARAVLTHVEQAAQLKQREVQAELSALNEEQLLALRDMAIPLPMQPSEVATVRKGRRRPPRDS